MKKYTLDKPDNFVVIFEEAIKLIPYVEFAMIYGLNIHYTICIVYPDFIVM